MSSKTAELMEKGLITGAPEFLRSSIQYEVIMGSMAYGVSNDTSDMDVYGFAIPPKEWVFPHLDNKVLGFDDYSPRFEQYQEHHIRDLSALGGKGREYDVSIYAIAKYFRLLMENNPNIIDSLYVPENCVLHSTAIGDMLRERRQLFLHKGCWAKFKGYSYGQMHKIRIKNPEGKRKDLVDKYGYDVKFAYHVVRLLNEVEQLLERHEMDLTLHREQLKSIRRGEWTLEAIEQYFTDKEKSLESQYAKTTLPDTPDTDAVRELLLNCLEQHYGTLDGCISRGDSNHQVLRDIRSLLGQAGY